MGSGYIRVEPDFSSILFCSLSSSPTSPLLYHQVSFLFFIAPVCELRKFKRKPATLNSICVRHGWVEGSFHLPQVCSYWNFLFLHFLRNRTGQYRDQFHVYHLRLPFSWFFQQLSSLFTNVLFGCWEYARKEKDYEVWFLNFSLSWTVGERARHPVTLSYLLWHGCVKFFIIWKQKQ